MERSLLKEVVATGLDLRVPAGDYHIVGLDELDHDDMLALVAEAAAHGGCVAELAPQYDGDAPSFVVALRVDAAWLLLEAGGTTLGLAGAVSSGVAVVAFSSVAYADGPALGPTSFVLGYQSARGDQIWEGDGWKLRRHPIAAGIGARDWPWRGSGGSSGPYSLTLRCEVGRDEIDQFVAGCAPLPYARVEAARYDIEGIGHIEIAPGVLRLVRAPGYGEAPGHVAAFDAGLLLAVARGGLGPLHWVVFEHDWETPFAIGDDGPSLEAYLLGDRDAVDAVQAALLAPCEIDATGIPEELAAPRIAAALGATDPVDDAAFDAWLARQPITALPRHVTIQFDRLARWSERLHAAQPGVVWRISGVG